MSSAITRRLEKANPASFSAYAIAAAFTTYFCMYAFRKPFAAAEFPGTADLPLVGELDYKILFIISQILGYCLSKFVGIKVVSELSPAKRAVGIVGVICVAEVALVLFALTPAPYNAIWMFVNGVPLGMVWGLVFGFLEGRKMTEALGAGLSASYMVASGTVRGVGRWLMDYRHDIAIQDVWMPAVVGLMFLPLLLLAVYLLKQLPAPSAEDEALRTKRVPMDSDARWRFLRQYAPGLFFLTFLYFFLTAYRDVRDNFATEILGSLVENPSPAMYAWSELPIAFGVMGALALIMLVKKNRLALVVVHAVMLSGAVLIGLSTLLWQIGLIGPITWYILVGLGCYLAYVPYGCVLFDRLIAAVGVMATAGFMIYVTDSFGYLGSVSVNLYKAFGQRDLSWVEFFTWFSYGTSILCTVCFLLSTAYFWRVTSAERLKEQREAGGADTPA